MSEEILATARQLIKDHDEWTFASQDLARPGSWDGTYAYAKEIVRQHDRIHELEQENERLTNASADIVVDYGQLQIRLDETEKERDLARQALREACFRWEQLRRDNGWEPDSDSHVEKLRKAGQ
jgi:hypothetical protein